MNGKPRLATHAHAARRGHAFVRRHDERVSLLAWQVVVLLEHGKLDGVEVPTDFGERELADLDEAEEPLGREPAVVPVRVAHVPVGAMSGHTESNTSGPCTSWAPICRQSCGL